MKQLLYILFLFIVGCSGNYNKDIWLKDLETNLEDYDEFLINRDFGFHRIKGIDELDSSFGIISLHGFYHEGWSGKGYEWVGPLYNLSKRQVPIWTYRYDWKECPENSVDSLYKHVDQLIKENDYLDSLWIIGHSFGGLISSLFSEKWDKDFSIKVHSIAAPLQKLSRTMLGCDTLERIQYNIREEVNYFQWRTEHSQDGFFKNLDYDPQEIKIINGKTVLLPKKWNGGSLGHNRSILFVSDILSN